jgi:hypothetical protein
MKERLLKFKRELTWRNRRVSSRRSNQINLKKKQKNKRLLRKYRLVRQMPQWKIFVNPFSNSSMMKHFTDYGLVLQMF